MSGFFDIEPLLEARLREKVSGIPEAQFYFPADLSEIAPQGNADASLHVAYLDYTPTDGMSPWEAGAQMKHRWGVVVAVRNAVQKRRGPELRKMVAPILDQVIEALKDWSPGLPDVRPGNLAPAPPILNTPEFSYFPLAFYFAMMV